MKELKTDNGCGKLVVKDGWLMCPVCGRGKVLRIQADTAARALPVYCRRCGQESIVNIDQSLSQCRKSTSA